MFTLTYSLLNFSLFFWSLGAFFETIACCSGHLERKISLENEHERCRSETGMRISNSLKFELGSSRAQRQIRWDSGLFSSLVLDQVNRRKVCMKHILEKKRSLLIATIERWRHKFGPEKLGWLWFDWQHGIKKTMCHPLDLKHQSSLLQKKKISRASQKLQRWLITTRRHLKELNKQFLWKSWRAKSLKI